MKANHHLPMLLFTAVLSLFYSCSNDEIVNNGNIIPAISGTVLNQNGLEAYPAKVWLNYDAYTEVNTDGTFKFSNVKFPYDLTINRPGTNEYTCFKGLTTLKPRLYFYTSTGPANQYQALIFVTFPPISPWGTTRTVILTEEKNCTISQTSSLDSSATYIIKWSRNSTINFRLVTIQFRRDENGNIITYDRFGFKDTSISSGETIYIKMSTTDMQYNPPESTLMLVMPSWVFLNDVEIGIAFDGYNKNSNIFLLETQGSALPLTYVVPGNLSLGYQVYAYLNYTGGNAYMLAGHGGIVYVPQYSPLNLLYPNNYDSADFNTEFLHSNSGNLFVTSFSASSQYTSCHFNVVSEFDSCRLPFLPAFGINFPSGTVFTWGVVRYNGFLNINEYASDKIVSNSQFATTYSQLRYFFLK